MARPFILPHELRLRDRLTRADLEPVYDVLEHDAAHVGLQADALHARSRLGARTRVHPAVLNGPRSQDVANPAPIC